MEMPSFTPFTGCSVPPYPVTGMGYGVSGVVDGHLTVCGGNILTLQLRKIIKACYYYHTSIIIMVKLAIQFLVENNNTDLLPFVVEKSSNVIIVAILE